MHKGSPIVCLCSLLLLMLLSSCGNAPISQTLPVQPTTSVDTPTNIPIDTPRLSALLDATQTQTPETALPITVQPSNTNTPILPTVIEPTQKPTPQPRVPTLQAPSPMPSLSMPTLPTPSLSMPTSPTPTPQPRAPTPSTSPQTQNAGTDTADIADTADTAATTSPGIILQNGETWHANGWGLTVTNFTYDTFHHISFTLHNNTERTVIFPEISTKGFRIVSDVGEVYAPCSIKGIGWYNTQWHSIGQNEIEANGTYAWEWEFYPYDVEHNECLLYGQSEASFSANTRTLTLTVENIADIIVDAHWQVQIPRP